MTENQEKELFTTLATLVTGVNKIQSDVSGLKSDVSGLKSDVSGLKSDVQEIKETLNEHSQILNRLDAKTDSIAEKVMSHEVRLSKAEKNIDDVRGGVH